jgi:hypothetical protein
LPTIGYEELPVPAGGDGPDVPAALADLATALDPRLVHDVTDLADRNSRFSTAPQHTLCIAADGTTWVKTSSGSNTWATLWEPVPAWQAVTPLSGYEEGSYPLQARKIGNQVFLRGRIQRTDGQVIPNDGVAIATVPTSCIPQEQIGAYAATSSLAGDVLIGVGKLEVLDVNTASSLGDPGTILWWSQDGATANGTPWVNISGSYWID